MNRIKTLRKNKNLTQVELAKIMGVAQNTLSTWESGRYEPDISATAKLADFFEVSIDYLMGRSDIPQKAKNIRDLDDSDFWVSITADEKQLILNYRDCPATIQKQIYRLAELHAAAEQLRLTMNEPVYGGVAAMGGEHFETSHTPAELKELERELRERYEKKGDE